MNLRKIFSTTLFLTTSLLLQASAGNPLPKAPDSSDIARSINLNEVVVTALGIKREEKGLGFSTTKVDNDMLSSAMPASWTSSLSGKVAGLNIVTPGGPVGTSRINLRGDVSLNQNGNNALIVVDGVPLSNTITNSGFAYGAGAEEFHGIMDNTEVHRKVCELLGI